MNGITDEMIAAGAQAMRAEGFVDWDDDTVPTFNDSDEAGDQLSSRINTWVPPEQVARAVLEAALAGRTVVDPNGIAIPQDLRRRLDYAYAAAHLGVSWTPGNPESTAGLSNDEALREAAEFLVALYDRVVAAESSESGEPRE